jgi:hypothetical protein
MRCWASHRLLRCICMLAPLGAEYKSEEDERKTSSFNCGPCQAHSYLALEGG